MVALPNRLFMSAAEYLDWEPTQEDRLLLESIGVEIAIADLYHQLQFEDDNLI